MSGSDDKCLAGVSFRSNGNFSPQGKDSAMYWFKSQTAKLFCNRVVVSKAILLLFSPCI